MLKLLRTVAEKTWGFSSFLVVEFCFSLQDWDSFTDREISCFSWKDLAVPAPRDSRNTCALLDMVERRSRTTCTRTILRPYLHMTSALPKKLLFKLSKKSSIGKSIKFRLTLDSLSMYRTVRGLSSVGTQQGPSVSSGSSRATTELKIAWFVWFRCASRGYGHVP